MNAQSTPAAFLLVIKLIHAGLAMNLRKFHVHVCVAGSDEAVLPGGGCV